MESTPQSLNYTLIIPGGYEFQFAGDITTSNFLKNMRADMEDTSNLVDLQECPCEFSNMTPAESKRFVELWEAFSKESGKKLNDLLDPQIVCLNPEVLEPISSLIKPTELDLVSTDEYIIAEFKKRSVELTPEDMSGIKQINTYQDLTENIALPTLFKCIRLANFLDIPTLLKLFYYLIARAMRAFNKLNKDIKPVPEKAVDESIAEPLDQELV